jgi:glucoamylase
MTPPVASLAHAPGWPGIEARWTSSAKSGVGTALGGDSRVWFTLSHGILNEIYYPRVDSACTRDLGLIVTDGAAYFSEEKRHARSEVLLLAPGVPAFHLRNTAIDGRYRIEKDVISDPSSDVVLQRVRFSALTDSPADRVDAAVQTRRRAQPFPGGGHGPKRDPGPLSQNRPAPPEQKHPH